MESNMTLILKCMHLELGQKSIKILKESKRELFDENIVSIEDWLCSKTAQNPEMLIQFFRLIKNVFMVNFV